MMFVISFMVVFIVCDVLDVWIMSEIVFFSVEYNVFLMDFNVAFTE